MVMDQYMSKTDELSDIQKKQYIAELGFEPILAHFNNEIKKHTCTPACDKMIELIEKRNRVFKLWRDELKEVDPGCLITSVNDRVGHMIRPIKRTGLLPIISNFFTVSFKRFIRK